jgi:hypothetical protein
MPWVVKKGCEMGSFVEEFGSLSQGRKSVLGHWPSQSADRPIQVIFVEDEANPRRTTLAAC